MLLICRYAFVVIMEGLWDVPALEMSLARGCCLSGVEECVCVWGGVFQDGISIPRGTCLLSKKA